MDADDEGKITSLDALMIMHAAADALDFERAIKLRDAVKELKMQVAAGIRRTAKRTLSSTSSRIQQFFKIL